MGDEGSSGEGEEPESPVNHARAAFFVFGLEASASGYDESGDDVGDADSGVDGRGFQAHQSCGEDSDTDDEHGQPVAHLRAIVVESSEHGGGQWER